jgi:hypothetical protein
MELDTVVSRRFKFIRIEVTHNSTLPARTNRLFTGLSASENLNMNDVMTLRSQLRVEIRAAIEDKVPWLHLFEF